jgi:hypothetical protein
MGPDHFPELKAFMLRYPIQLRSTVGHNELHEGCPHKFSDKFLVKKPDALTVQCAALVPKFSERQFRDYPLVSSQATCLIQKSNLPRFGSTARLA